VSQAGDQAAAAPRLSRLHNLLYSAGELAPNALGLLVPAWVLTLYRGSEAEGIAPLVSAQMFAAVFIIGRLLDAISDPLVGYWSDRTRTRWGRRYPFMALSSPFLALSFVLLWLPPQDGLATANGVWLVALLTAYFFAFTCYYAPYLGLLPELTPIAADRNSVSTWQAVFKVVGMVGPVLLFGRLYDLYGGQSAGRLACFTPGLAVGALAFVALLIPLFGRRESQVLEAPQEHDSLWGNIGEALASRPFRHFVGAFFMSWFGVQLLLVVLRVMPVAALGVPAEQAGSAAAALQSLAILAGAGSFPLIRWAMDRYGRAKTFSAALVWFGAVSAALMAVHSLTAARVALVLAGPGVGAFLVLPHALMADVCDHHTKRTGRRREAVFFGVQGLIVKGAMALAVPAADLLLTTFGASVTRSGGILAAFAVSSGAAALGWLSFRGFAAALATPLESSDG